MPRIYFIFFEIPRFNFILSCRAALFATDVNWRKTKIPWETYGYYDGKQYKFINPTGIDYKLYGKDRPQL